MAIKTIILADPGIDTAFAIALAYQDPQIEVLGLLATAGNVDADQATQNCLVLNDQLDPLKWPRVGAALPLRYSMDGTVVHGPGGLGGVRFPEVHLHSPISSDRLLVELAKEHPKQVALLVLGPLSTVAIAFERHPELVEMLDRIICVGGAWREHGNVGPVSEFHFALDPEAVRSVFQHRLPIIVIPLDVTRRLILSPTDLLGHSQEDSKVNRFLRKIIPFGIRATANQYGIEGFHLKDVLGVIALARPQTFSIRSVFADCETKGELTRGMLVVDTRPSPGHKPNIDLAIDVDEMLAREYLVETLGWR